MFDIGFLELLLISIIALLVIGPEKLPGAIRTLGLWVGRIRRMLTNIQRDIEHELRAEEMRQKMEKQMAEIQSLKETVENQIKTPPIEGSAQRVDEPTEKEATPHSASATLSKEDPQTNNPPSSVAQTTHNNTSHTDKPEFDPNESVNLSEGEADNMVALDKVASAELNTDVTLKEMAQRTKNSSSPSSKLSNKPSNS